MSNIEQRIIENEIEKSLGNDFSIEKAFDTLDIIKGKRAQLGEIREWRGGKFRRTTNGWERIKESGKDSRGSRDNGINDDLQVNHDTTASKKGEDPMKVPEGVDQAQYKDIVSDQSDRPSIHFLTIDGKEWKVNREIDRSGGQFTPYYVFEGGDGKKYWDLNAGIRAHRSSSKPTNVKGTIEGWEDRGFGMYRKKYKNSPIESLLIKNNIDYDGDYPRKYYEVTTGTMQLPNERDAKSFYEKIDKLTSQRFSSKEEAAQAADDFMKQFTK